MSHFIVSNIPTKYRSAKLRKYFAQYVEKAAFECFHFRHRPEERREENRSEGDGTTTKTETCCCVVKVKAEYVAEFVKTYHGKVWEEEQRGLGCSMILPVHCDEALSRLPELQPPSVMPCGNVGTPTIVFRDMVNNCTLPPVIIKKLGLVFPRLVKRKQYSAVLPPADLYKAPARPPTKDYSKLYKPLPKHDPGSSVEDTPGGESTPETGEQGDCTAPGQEGAGVPGAGEQGDCTAGSETGITSERNVEESSPAQSTVKEEGHSGEKAGKEKRSKEWKQRGVEEEEDEAGRSNKEQTEEDGEDWDRHCQLHNDVDTQARTKEMNRLFESEMEVVWDKGSSGLVFYTDGNYWAELEGKDTDELWADDWDVDMGVYEGQEGDKDSQDLLAMRRSKRQKKTGDLEQEEEIGDFEKYTNGFGSRMMRKQGWNVGAGLGKAEHGVKEALDAEGGMPSWKKTGFGYKESMLEKILKRKHEATRAPPTLGSKFDTVIQENESMYRTHDENAMKYRRPK